MLSVTIGGGETPAEKPAEAATATKPDAIAPAALNPQNPATKKDERPAWLPEQFKDAEQLAASYAELRAMLSRGEKLPAEEKPVEKPAAEPEKKVEEKPANADLAKTDDEIRAEAAAKNLNFEDFTKEYAEKGALTDESYKKLADAGYDKARVDAWIEGRVAVAEKRSSELFEIVGGKDEFTKVSAWAQANMPKAEIEAFNRATGSGDQDLAKLAVTGLFAKFTAANGKEPVLLGGKPSGASDVYRSRAELTADIKDPRYTRDAAFRKDVEEKAMRSPI
jgi:hypothetical protein